MKQSVEYLLTRRDIDAPRLGYIGVSAGATLGPIMLSLENRFKTAVLLAGGLPLEAVPLPDIDVFNFLPRVRVPVLMVNGRHDYTYPMETSQQPYFRWLGTSEKDKRHIVCDSAHDVFVQRAQVVRDALSWLDQYLGPVAR